MANKPTRPKDNFFQKASSKNTNMKPSTEGSNDFFVRSSSRSENTEKKQKKPFDKSKWRLQKYSMKHRIENWEERRKKAIVRDYQKQRNQDKASFNVSKIYDEEEKRLEEENPTDTKQKKVFKKPHEQFLEKQEEKKRQREEFLRRKAEKQEAMERYKKKKVERYKKLNRKTRRGQPIMKDRMEYLLEKIQQSIDV